jgi:dienelactone hydrolase
VHRFLTLSKQPGAVLAVFALALLSVTACSRSSSDSNKASGDRRVGTVFPVGISSFTFVDESRPTPANATQPGSPTRTLSVRVWYPAVAPSADEARDDDFSSVPDPSPSFDAPPATGAGPFPLIVFGHGLGGVPAVYGDLLESWAAAGFVVAAPAFPLSNENSPGGPDAGDVSNQPGDVSAVITEALTLSSSAEGRVLAGMIDGEHIGVAGHSNGGITTAGLIGQSCCFDDRVDAAIIIAGTSQLFPGGTFDWSRTPPLLVMHGEDDTLIPLDEGKRLFNNARSPKGLFTLLGIDHGSFLVRDFA